MGNPAIIYSDKYLEHDTGGHVENVDRLRSIKRGLEDAPFADALEWVAPREATVEEIGLIHEAAYIDDVRRMCAGARGIAYLNPDTAVCSESYNAAILAAGGVITGIDRLLDGKNSSFFAAVRPPGHHAEYDESLGFCLFNNIAIGARYAIERRGLQRVFILDWDVHHGNGTQHSLESDPSVFFLSLHQFPHYPGTGRHTEHGRGDGVGRTMNFPMTAGAGDADYFHLMDKVAAAAIKKFDPQLMLISAGFDAHEDDPLSSIALSSEAFGEMTDIILGAVGPECRVGLVLEGGYNLRALAESAACAVGRLAGEQDRAGRRGTPSRRTLEMEDYMKSQHPFFAE